MGPTPARAAAADALGITRIRVNEIIRGRRGVTPDTAFRLSRFFGTTVDFWMGLQADVDGWDTLSTRGNEYELIKPISHTTND
ncbi:MAG: HigA family addiction module antitoxin [Syntrophobacteraceae bacterium]|nr:HigA family addiction module antitoxin [Syntrophobacteraceae bacterium]